MHNDIYDIEGQLGIKKPRARTPEVQASRPQNGGNVPSSDLQQGGRSQASPESPYANIPQDVLNQRAVSNANGAQPRVESPYANIPPNLQQQANIAQGDRASQPPPRPPRRDLGETEPRAPRQDLGGRRDTVAIPQGEQKPANLQMTGTFVTHVGRGYDTNQMGLVFKPTGQGEMLYHFSPSQSQQLKASNEELIKQSMQNGDQAKVTLTKDARDRTTWKVEPVDQQQQQQSRRNR